MKKYLFLIIAVAVGVIIQLTALLIKEKAECKRLSRNQEALIYQCKEYQSKSGKNAMSAMEQKLSYAELKKSYTDIIGKAEDLRIKVKRLQSASISSTKTKIAFQTALRDSIIYRDRILTDTLYKYLETIKTFQWKDPWVVCNGNIVNDSIRIDVTSNDTITTIVHRVPKRWLFFRWGTKAIKQEVICSNPHTRLTYTKYVKLIR